MCEGGRGQRGTPEKNVFYLTPYNQCFIILKIETITKKYIFVMSKNIDVFKPLIWYKLPVQYHGNMIPICSYAHVVNEILYKLLYQFPVISANAARTVHNYGDV